MTCGASVAAGCGPTEASVRLLRTSTCRTYVFSSRRRPHTVCRAADPDFAHPGNDLATEFSNRLNASGLEAQLRNRRPTHLMPPTTVVESQLNALQMNDWPETDAGVKAAYSFSKPQACEEMLVGQVMPARARSWQGREEWVSLQDFSNMLHSSPYNVLLNCDSWQFVSQMAFNLSRKGEMALQAVEVKAKRQGAAAEQDLRPYTFTFCLEKIKTGPYKDCWMTIGLRCGNYTV